MGLPLEEKDQFAEEMDHFAWCIKKDMHLHSPAEEGLQDQRITDAIYESATMGRKVIIQLPIGPTRAPELKEES